MADLKKTAELYGGLVAQAEKFPALFNKLLQQSHTFLEANQQAHRHFQEAASATFSRKGDVLNEAADDIGKAAEALQSMSSDLELIGQIHKRIQAIKAEISDEIG